MVQDPLPGHGQEGEEPDSSPLPSASEDPGPEDDPSPEQGLYITLPAGHLTLAGFCQGGASDTLAPGALLAAVALSACGGAGSSAAGGGAASSPSTSASALPDTGKAAVFFVVESGWATLQLSR